MEVFEARVPPSRVKHLRQSKHSDSEVVVCLLGQNIIHASNMCTKK